VSPSPRLLASAGVIATVAAIACASVGVPLRGDGPHLTSGMQSARADRHAESGYNMAVRNVVLATPLPGTAMTCIVRHPDTELVIATTSTITETTAIEHG
jgi:hypothetical protein